MLLLLQFDPAAIMQPLLMLGMFVVFYFFMIRPQQQKAQALRKLVENLKKGDDVVTIGGIHGKVVSINENTVTLETMGGGKILLDKSAVARLKSDAS